MEERRARILEYIYEHGGSYCYEIAKELGEHRSTVDKALKSFEEFNFIIHDESRGNKLRNKKWYKASELGREFIVSYRKYRDAASRYDLSDDDRINLGSTLKDELGEENFDRAIKAGLIQIKEYIIGKLRVFYFKGFGAIIFDNENRRILRSFV